MARQLYLLDASSYIYRAFYALPRLTTKEGIPTGAVYGFTRMLLSLINKKKIEYLGLCFDIGGPTFRHRQFPEYKAIRPAMPEDLKSQLSIIREVVKAFHLASFEKEGYEADDVIATLVYKAKERYDKIIIVSCDKDILQVVDEVVEVLNPFLKEGLFDSQKVEETLGVPPERVSDLLALAGDSVDNIGGVEGIGRRGAQKLLREFGSVENLLAKVNEIKEEKVREKIKENTSRILQNKKLTTLFRDVPVEVDWSKMALNEYDWCSLRKIFESLGFRKLLKELEPTLFS